MTSVNGTYKNLPLSPTRLGPHVVDYTMDICTSRPNRPGPDLRIQGLSIGQRWGPPCAPFAPIFRRLVVQAYPHTINGFVLCILSLCATYVVHGRTTHPVLVSTHAAHCAHRIKRHRQNRAEIGSAISGHYRSRRLPAAGRLPHAAIPRAAIPHAAIPCAAIP